MMRNLLHLRAESAPRRAPSQCCQCEFQRPESSLRTEPLAQRVQALRQLDVRAAIFDEYEARTWVVTPAETVPAEEAEDLKDEQKELLSTTAGLCAGCDLCIGKLDIGKCKVDTGISIQ